jgi:hypothetical protein
MLVSLSRPPGSLGDVARDAWRHFPVTRRDDESVRPIRMDEFIVTSAADADPSLTLQPGDDPPRLGFHRAAPRSAHFNVYRP